MKVNHELNKIIRSRGISVKDQSESAVLLMLSIIIAALCILLSFMQSNAGADEINMAKIAQIESSGNPLAHNKADDSRGLYQITPICLKEYNNFHKVKYSMNDLWSPEVSHKIADWYLNVRIPQMLKHYGLKDTIRNRVWAYNAGIVNVINNRIPKTTQSYFKKYGV